MINGGVYMPEIHYYKGELIEPNDRPIGWFYDHHKELFQKYGKCYLSIRNEDNVVLGAYKTHREALRETLFHYEENEFNIYLCDGATDQKYDLIPNYMWVRRTVIE